MNPHSSAPLPSSAPSSQLSCRSWQSLSGHDEAVYKLIEEELSRQQDGLEMIASENFVSPQILAATGNPLTNKYAEGLPSKRYYGGCEYIDALEDLAIHRAKKLFGVSYANVQPHSGANANTAVYLGLLQAGDTILGMDICAGGHLSHGASVNMSGVLYQSHGYGVDHQSHLLDYEAIHQQAREVSPKLIIAGASAYPRVWDFARFRKIADDVGAYLLVDMAHIAGLVAAGVHPSPAPFANIITTTTHKTLRGPRGGLILWNDESLTPKLNKGVFPLSQGGPLEHIIAMKAVCFHEASMPEFVEYQRATVRNAHAFADELLKGGLSVVSGGTDNHLILLSLLGSSLSGKVVEKALEEAGITVNKNTVPGETRSPFETSGIRFGTPALTTRGLTESDFRLIASWVIRVIAELEKGSTSYLDEIKRGVTNLCARYPLYPMWQA